MPGMSQPGMILDYASPRKRSALRMASRSVLDYVWADHGRGVVVRERLEEQTPAVFGIGVSAVAVGALLWLMVVNGEWRRTPRELLWLPAGLVAAWAAVVPIVIQRSWGRTELSVRGGADGIVRLWTGGPLAHRAYEWRIDQVHDVRVIVMPLAGAGFALGEIEILAEGTPPVRLFTDHTEWKLSGVARAIGQAMRGERSGPLYAAAAANAGAAPPPADHR